MLEKVKKNILNSREKQCINHLIKNEYISRAEYAKLFKISIRTANYDLKYLEDLKLIGKEGAGRTIKYKLFFETLKNSK